MEQNSIGIIGGADGPTVVMVSGSILPLVIGAVLIVLAVVGVILLIRLRKKKK